MTHWLSDEEDERVVPAIASAGRRDGPGTG